MVSTGAALGIANMIAGSVDTAFAKYLTPRLGKYRYAVLILGFGIIFNLIYFLIAGGLKFPSIGTLLLTFIGGAFFGEGFLLFYKAMETQQITHAAALGEITPLILLIFGVMVLGESVTLMEGLGALIIFAGAFLVLTTEKMRINWLLVPIILANLSWSIYWILMTYAIRDYGGESFPVLFARIFAFLMVAIYAIGTRKMEKDIKKPMTGYHHTLLYAFLAVSAFLDSSVNLLLGFIININLLALGSILLAAGPLLTSVLGRFFFNDRLNYTQKIGFVLAVIGSVLIGLT